MIVNVMFPGTARSGFILFNLLTLAKQTRSWPSPKRVLYQNDI